MRGKLWFLGGLAAGFVLGARAGREKYEELVQAARKVKEHPTVQEAAGVVQEQTSRLFTEGREMVADKLSHTKLAETKFGERLISAADPEAGARAIHHNDMLEDSTLATAGSTPKTNTSGTTTPGSGTTPGMGTSP
jgi:hypothetical protein